LMAARWPPLLPASTAVHKVGDNTHQLYKGQFPNT
jgi:hypothetical protein